MSENPAPLARVLTLTERLTALITQESALLHERRAREITDFHAEKIRLSELYAREMETLRRNSSLIKTAPPAEMARFKQLTALFREALAENKRIVQALKSVTEGMIRSIADEVTRRNNPVNGYGGDAVLKRQGAPAPTSIALNQVI
ncbi:MAG: hypothetical protein ACE5EM_00420 [Sphingomonadales bacterium]